MCKVIIEFNSEHDPQYMWAAKHAQDVLTMVVNDIIDDYKFQDEFAGIQFFVGPYEEYKDNGNWHLKAAEVINTSYYALYEKLYQFAIKQK